MTSAIATFTGLFIIYATLIVTVYCVEIKDETLSVDERIALTRDHRGRLDPDALLNGFFPVWAAVQLCIAAFFFLITIVSLVCYILGCRTPAEERNKRNK